MSETLQRTDFCVLPWIGHILYHNSSKICCYGGKVATYFFPDYEGPWKGEDTLSNPVFVRKRELMYDVGTRSCPDACPIKHGLSTVEQQIARYCESTDTSHKLRALLKSGSTDTIPPLVLTISVTLKCNQACPICVMNISESQVDRKEPTIEEIQNLYPLYENVRFFGTTGGDVFGMSDEMIDAYFKPFAKKDVSGGVTTNGRGLNLDRYTRFCENGQIKRIKLSISSLQEDVYRQIHGCSPKPVIKNVVDITGKYPNHHINCISYVLTSVNIGCLLDLIRFAHDNGIPNIAIIKLIPLHLGKHNISYLDLCGEGYSDDRGRELRETVERARELAKQVGVNLINLTHVLGLFNRWQLSRSS